MSLSRWIRGPTSTSRKWKLLAERQLCSCEHRQVWADRVYGSGRGLQYLAVIWYMHMIKYLEWNTCIGFALVQFRGRSHIMLSQPTLSLVEGRTYSFFLWSKSSYLLLAPKNGALRRGTYRNSHPHPTHPLIAFGHFKPVYTVAACGKVDHGRPRQSQVQSGEARHSQMQCWKDPSFLKGRHFEDIKYDTEICLGHQYNII